MTSWGRQACASLLVAAVLAAGVLLGTTPPAHAAIEPSCRIQQVTHRAPGAHAAGSALVSDDGERLLFFSRLDLVGRNADQNFEIYDWTFATGGVRQLTSSVGELGPHLFAASPDGRRLLVSSDRQAPSERRRLFHVDLDSGTWTPISGYAPILWNAASDPELEHVAFVSGGGPNASPSDVMELRLWTRATGEVEQLTGGSSHDLVDIPERPAIDVSPDGRFVAYASTRDEIGDDGNDDGNAEAFLFDVELQQRVQLTHSVDEEPAVDSYRIRAGASWLTFDGDGRRLAIGGNLGPNGTVGGAHVTLADIADGTPTLTPILARTDGSMIGSVGLSLDGTRVLTEVAAGPPAATSLGLEDLAGRWSEPALVAQGEVGSSSLSGDGTRVAFLSDEDLVGENPSHRAQLFAADCRTFRDISPRHPFAVDIEWAAEEGIAGGYADATFRPGAPVSRQAAVAFLHRLAGSPEVTLPPSPSFADVGPSHPFRDEVEWAAAEGITSGYSDGTFRPLSTVTRQAMAAFLFAFAEPDGFAAPGTPTFDDVPTSHPFAEPIEWAASEAIVTGYSDGTFRPAATVTRQAAAAFLHRLAGLS